MKIFLQIKNLISEKEIETVEKIKCKIIFIVYLKEYFAKIYLYI